MTSISTDLEIEDFLSILYGPVNEDCKMEFGFLSLIISKGNRKLHKYFITQFMIEIIEIFASHSTPSFIFGWKLSGNTETSIHISRLTDKIFKSFGKCLQIK